LFKKITNATRAAGIRHRSQGPVTPSRRASRSASKTIASMYRGESPTPIPSRRPALKQLRGPLHHDCAFGRDHQTRFQIPRDYRRGGLTSQPSHLVRETMRDNRTPPVMRPVLVKALSWDLPVLHPCICCGEQRSAGPLLRCESCPGEGCHLTLALPEPASFTKF